MIQASRVVTDEHVWTPGWLEMESGIVTALGPGVAPGGAVDVVEGTIVPGFVDIHVHGAVGHDFGSTDDAGIDAAVGHHLARGTTTMLASVATAPLADLEEALRRLAPRVVDGTLAGIHLEGPFLSPLHRGAHNPVALREPRLDEVQRLLAAARGALRVVTLAPELPGASAAVGVLLDANVVVALGHTAADAAQTRAALDAGATLMTHFFNGMPPLHHRRPGPVAVGLTDQRVALELIVDGQHLDPSIVRLVRESAPGRYLLVSDAMSATGEPDGEYEIAGSSVIVSDGVARLADHCSLAGSTSTVSDGFRMLVLDSGADLPEAVRATSTTPRLAARLPAGGLEAGASADLVVLDEELRVRRVSKAGRWVA